MDMLVVPHYLAVACTGNCQQWGTFDPLAVPHGSIASSVLDRPDTRAGGIADGPACLMADGPEGSVADGPDGGVADAPHGGATDAPDGGAADTPEGSAVDAQDDGTADAWDGLVVAARDGGCITGGGTPWVTDAAATGSEKAFSGGAEFRAQLGAHDGAKAMNGVVANFEARPPPRGQAQLS